MRHRAGRFALQLTLGLLLGGLIAGASIVLSDGGSAEATHGTAEIELASNGDGIFADAADGALTTTFSTNTQTLYAGSIEVRNGGADPWTVGYVIENEAQVTLDDPANAHLNGAIRVAINALADIGTACAGVDGTAVPVQGTAIVAQSAGTSFDGLNTMTPRTAINAAGADERLCFYLYLDNADSNVAGGSVSYTLTFTASTDDHPPSPPPSGGGGGGGGGGSTPTPTATPSATPTPAPGDPVVDLEGVDEATVVAGEPATVATTSEAGGATVTAPAGALPAGGTLTAASVADLNALVAQAPPPDGAKVVLGFVLQAADAQGAAVTGNFAAPVRVEFTVAAGSVPDGAEAGALVLVFWNGSAWVEAGGTVVANADGSFTIRADLMHFTVFAVLHQPDRGTFAFAPQPGVTVTVWRGGPLALLPSAAPAAQSFWVTDGGRMVGYVPDAPAFVNVDFFLLFPDGGVPAGRPMIVVQPRTSPPSTPAPPLPPGASTPAPAATPPAAPGTHVVVLGDTLLSVAAEYGVDWSALAAANGIEGPDYILPLGAVLTIPADAPVREDGRPSRYVVRPGDSLISIAELLGLDWFALARHNGYTGPEYLVWIGQVLEIPIAPAPDPAGPPRTITVQPGDTLLSIAAILGVDWRDIAALNGLDPPDYVVEAGEVLLVP